PHSEWQRCAPSSGIAHLVIVSHDFGQMSWKHHPLAVPILTFAGTMTFCFTIVMPIWDRIKDNEIATLRAEPAQLKARLDGITQQLDHIEGENQKLRADLDKLRPGDLFSMDDYY